MCAGHGLEIFSPSHAFGCIDKSKLSVGNVMVVQVREAKTAKRMQKRIESPLLY
jgi:hypothetical protein